MKAQKVFIMKKSYVEDKALENLQKKMKEYKMMHLAKEPIIGQNCDERIICFSNSAADF